MFLFPLILHSAKTNSLYFFGKFDHPLSTIIDTTLGRPQSKENTSIGGVG